MLDAFKKKARSLPTSEILLAFINSWDMHGADELAISSGALDVTRACLGDRPCCIWKKNGSGLTRLTERGMVEFYFSDENTAAKAALNRALHSGAPEFESQPFGILAPAIDQSLDGFLHLPMKIKDEMLGIFSLGVKKKEARDRSFVQPLECLARLVAIALRESSDVEANRNRERQLRSEVEATMRELEGTNKKLIDRVRDLKALSAELQDRVAELTVANKAKDEFLSIVSHELRTPLTSLNGFLCVLLDGEAGSITDEQRKFLTIAKQSTDRLNGMISDLLDISRLESGRLTLEMDTCSMSEIISSSVEKQRASAEQKNIRLNWTQSTLPFVVGDKKRLAQVLDSIIANAVKFTDREGQIDVWVEEKGDLIQVAVRDTGLGLSPEDQKKVFDVFYQVDASMKRAAGGAGLGLSIARGIITMHKGQIWVESEIGKGSTFKFALPRSKEQKAA